MGGKTKQSQRTKNNVRPSSSGRSAELLNNAVNLDSWKTSGGGKMATLFPTLNSPIIDQGLSPEFSVCIKKLNKKDPITKTKALQELTELVNNSEVDDVVTVLPSWAHFYKILAVDTDCKVREATQSCHFAITHVCGRRLAPVLRQVVPAWLQAQYDDHAPAMTLANNSLKSTFPENKLPEVISFCKAEVVANLLENISGSMDKAILNRIDSPEERELQQQRLISSSLQGLRYLAQHTPDAHRDWLWEQLTPLVASNAFWKLANHASPQIRGAWFGAMSSVLSRFGGALDDGARGRCARTLLHAPHAHHAQHDACAPQLWGCLLAFVYSVPVYDPMKRSHSPIMFQDWHKWMDKKDLLTKKILDMLERGGWGDARRLADSLLPLLAHAPRAVLTRSFYEAFFDAFFKGLEKKTILSSKSERQYWITSLSECLRYLSIQSDDYVVEVVTSVHRTWVKRALAVERDSQLRNNLVKHSATSMAALVKYWLKQSKEPNGEKYDQLVRNFWQNVASTALAQVDQSTVDTVTKTLDGHILLLQTLKTAFLSENKKLLSIKFVGDPSTQAERPEPTQEADAASLERYNHNLNDTVEKICCGYFEFADEKDLCEIVLAPLITILNEFDNKALYLALAKHFNATGVYDLYDKVLRRWMATGTTRCKPVVDVVFILLKHLTEEEQDVVLASFDQFPCEAAEWCLTCALGHAQWSVPAARRWLRSGRAERALLRLLRRLLRLQGAAGRNLLVVCLSRGDGDREMVIGAATAMRIAGVVSAELRSLRSLRGGAGAGEPLDLEHAASLAAHLATALAPHDHPGKDYLGLLLDLFDLIAVVPRTSPRLSSETWCEVRSAVQDGVQAAGPERLAALLAAAADVLRRHLATLTETVSVSQIEHMVSLCPLAAFPQRPSAAAPHLDLFSRRMFAAPPGDVRRRVEVCALRYDCIVGDLNCPVDDNDVIKLIIQESTEENVADLTKKDFVAFANDMLFRASYLHTMLLHKKDEDCEESYADLDEESEGKDDVKREVKEEGEDTDKGQDPSKSTDSERMVNDLLTKDYFLKEYCEVIYEHMVVNTLCQAYGFWVHHDLILQTSKKTEAIIRDIIAYTSDEVRLMVYEKLKEKSMSIGYYWAYAKVWYEAAINEGSKPLVIMTPGEFDTSNPNGQNGNGFFHTLQASVERRPVQEHDAVKVKFALMVRCILLAYETDEAFVSKAIDACNQCSLDPMIALYHELQDSTLYERAISSLSWQAAAAEAMLARGLAEALRLGGWEAPPHHWDFATVTLCSLMEALRKSDPRYSSTKVCMLWWATCRLYSSVRSFVGGIRLESTRRRPPPHVLDLLSEWQDVFAPALHRDLYLIALSLIENGSMKINSGTVRTVSAVNEAIKQAEWRHIDSAHRNDSLSLERLVDRCGAALARPLHPAYHCLAYSVLLQLAEPLDEFSEQSLAAWSAGGTEEGEARERPRLAPNLLQPPFSRALDLADAALAGHTAGEDSCEMVPGSDAHAVVLGCLLLAEALHRVCARAKGELQHHYIQAYRENKYAEFLLPVVLRLLPRALLNLVLQPNSHAPLPASYAEYFHHPPTFEADDPRWLRCVPRVSCRCVYTVTGGAGAGGSRGWWGAAGRAGRPLARLVAAYVSPGLIRAQLDLLQARRADLEDTEVTILWSSHEAHVVHRVEDRPVELQVKFEAEFPLVPPRVAAPTVRPSVNTGWVAMYIAYQNGTLLNAVKMWSSALNSKVESSPQCYVCYCRLHPATGHLPQVRCHQCRNRFHTACLHKWFVSSHKSNCPLCRSNF